MVELWVIQMKNNILNHFAFNDLKNHKKDTLMTFIILVFIAVICILLTSLTPIFGNHYVLEFQKEYGAFDYTTKNTYTKDQLNQMIISLDGVKKPLQEADVKTCFIQNLGYTFTDDSINYIIGDPTIIAVRIQQGRLPTQKHEIAIKKEVLEKYGYSDELGKTVEIPYVGLDGQMQVGRWYITGILEESGESSIVTMNEDKEERYRIYLQTDDSKVIDNAYELGLDSMFYTEDFLTDHQLDILIVMVQFVLFIVGCVILSGMTIASFDNRKDDYALLRGIGATRRQLYYVVFLQSLIFIVASVSVAFGISFLIISLLKNVIETIIPITFFSSYLIGIVFIISLMTFISYFMPARSASYRALTGSFQNNEFQYFYYRYKKLHHMRPFYLGWRQLVAHKKQMIVKIFLIFIASLMLLDMIGMSIYNQSLQQQKENLVKPQNHQQMTIEFTVYEDKTINIHDFDAFKSYASQIDYHHTFKLHDYSDGYGKVYCFDENLAQNFWIKNINPGEIIVSSQFAETYGKNEVNIQDDVYKIQHQIGEYEEEFIVMSVDDFQKYGDMNHYQNVIVKFDSIDKKTQGLIAFAKQGGHIKYFWKDSLANEQLNLSQEVTQDAKEIPIIQISILLIAGFIYMYQLSYEILKQRYTIGSYQLIGLRKIEIWLIYAYKSMLIAFIGFICAIYYHFADMMIQYGANGGWHIFMDGIPLIKQILPVLVMIFIFISISLFPLYYILKNDGLENINVKD